MPLIIPANTLSADDYEISNSGLFNGTNQKLTYSLGSSSASWTFSCWVKRDNDFSTNNYIISWGSSGTDGTGIGFGSVSSVTPRFFYYSEDSPDNILISSTGVYRDCAAWSHCVVKCDSGTVTLYINGESVGSGSGGNPLDTSTLYVGSWIGANLFWGGYLADVYFIDGTAYDASSFGKSNDNGVWVPKKASVTFGTHGFFLEFGNTGTGVGSGRFASDTSGEANHLDTNNFSGQYQMTDTPTNNFCTLNPNDKGSEVNTVTQGNLKATWNGANGHSIRSTIAVNDGKWYWEISGADNLASGIVHTDEPIIPTSGGLFPGGSGYGAGNSYAYILGDGKTRTNNAQTTYGESVSTSETLGCALDLDNGKIYWSVDGVWQNSGDPSGTNPAYTGIETSGKFFSPAWGYQTGGESAVYVNFGNPQVTISSGNADANGYGNFEYAVPSGYYALCTKNLAEFG